MKEIGRGLAAIGLEVDRIVSSPLPRALRTAQIVARELDMVNRLETSDVLAAGSEAMTIRDWLRGRTDERLMIVGHNPAFSELIGLLVLGETGRLPLELKKGGIAALSASESSLAALQDRLDRPASSAPSPGWRLSRAAPVECVGGDDPPRAGIQAHLTVSSPTGPQPQIATVSPFSMPQFSAAM